MLGHNLSRARPTLPGASCPAPGPLPLAHIRKASAAPSRSAPIHRRWVLEFERSAPVSLDPLTGWPVTSDPLSQVRMTFPDMQSAIDFAERKGWRYVVEEPETPQLRPRIPPEHVPARWPFRAERLTAVEAPASARVDDDRVDEALLETFPASDPPAWTLGARSCAAIFRAA